MNILKYASMLSIFLFLSVNLFSEARVKYEALIKVKKDMNLVVDNKNGNIKIERWNFDTIELRAVKFSFSWGAKDEIDNVEIIPFQSGNDVVIETRYPEYLETAKVAVYYTIMIPDFINIKELQNSNGKIEINGGSGNCIISTSNGRIQVNDYEGDIEAYTSNGGIYLNNIFGNCSGTTSNARIKVSNVEGNLDFTNANAGISFENITGNISAIADNGKISVSSSTGNMKLKTSFGSIEAFDSEGDLLLFSSFGKIQVENISGFVSAKTDNGSVKIIETSGIITAETANGDIEADILDLYEEGTILKSRMGSIKVFISTDLNGIVKINNRKGKIDLSETDIDFERKSNGKFIGEIGDGGRELFIETQNGKISVIDF